MHIKMINNNAMKYEPFDVLWQIVKATHPLVTED